MQRLGYGRWVVQSQAPPPDPPEVGHHEQAAQHWVGLSAAREVELLISNHFRSVQVDIDLPQIAVIGNQSAGKSSLIEAISGITLPATPAPALGKHLSRYW